MPVAPRSGSVELVDEQELENPVAVLRLVALGLLLVAILFCGYAIISYQRRNRLLRMKSGDGYDDFKAPLLLGAVVVLILAVVYGVYLYQNTVIHL